MAGTADTVTTAPPVSYYPDAGRADVIQVLFAHTATLSIAPVQQYPIMELQDLTVLQPNASIF